MFNIGDRVRYIGNDKRFKEQSQKGEGIYDGPVSSFQAWGRVTWDHGLTNAYPLKDLGLASLRHNPMTSEMELEEIEMAQEIYSKLEGR